MGTGLAAVQLRMWAGTRFKLPPSLALCYNFIVDRRDLLFGTAGIALGQNLAAKTVGRPAPLGSTRKVRMAIAGGGFGSTFFFHQHPNCIVAAVTDLRADRRKRLSEVYRCDNMYNSLEELLTKEKRLDAVALFTPAPEHVKHAT